MPVVLSFGFRRRLIWPTTACLVSAEHVVSSADVIGARKSRIHLGSSVIATVAKHALIPVMIKVTGGRWLALFAVFLMTATSLTVPSRVGRRVRSSTVHHRLQSGLPVSLVRSEARKT